MCNQIQRCSSDLTAKIPPQNSYLTRYLQHRIISWLVHMYLYLYFKYIDPYWLQRLSDIEHDTYAYISSKHRTSRLTTTFTIETSFLSPLAPTVDHFINSWSFYRRYNSLKGWPAHRKASSKHRINAHTPNIHALLGIRTHDPGFWASKDSTCLKTAQLQWLA
jgi:hypothetical protein